MIEDEVRDELEVFLFFCVSAYSSSLVENVTITKND